MSTHKLLAMCRVFIITIVVLLLAAPAPGGNSIALAADLTPWTFHKGVEDAEKISTGAKIPVAKSISVFVSELIVWALSFMAIIALIVLLIGGFRYITSLGNESKTESAKKTILYAIIGMFLIGLSFAIIFALETFLTGGAPGA